MPNEARFAELLEAARQGQDEAAAELVASYGPHVMRTIRRTLSREIRGKFDSIDFAQAVWASLFSSPEQLDGVKEPQQLVGLLATMARNKVIDELRRRVQTQKYSVRRERPLYDENHGEGELASRDPTPSQFAIARERWVSMLRAQPAHHRQVIRLKLMGKTNRSIATQLGLSERTVGRVLDRLMEEPGDEQVREP
jgi:RNA polymerase sigma-70 factor (ECF subfamily)